MASTKLPSWPQAGQADMDHKSSSYTDALFRCSPSRQEHEGEDEARQATSAGHVHHGTDGNDEQAPVSAPTTDCQQAALWEEIQRPAPWENSEWIPHEHRASLEEVQSQQAPLRGDFNQTSHEGQEAEVDYLGSRPVPSNRLTPESHAPSIEITRATPSPRKTVHERRGSPTRFAPLVPAKPPPTPIPSPFGSPLARFDSNDYVKNFVYTPANVREVLREVGDSRVILP